MRSKGGSILQFPSVLPSRGKIGRRLGALVWVIGLLAQGPQALETNREYGAASYQFLKLPLSPRVTALAGAGVALVEGAGEAEFNPAAMVGDAGRLVLGYGTPYAEFGAQASHIAWNIPLGDHRLWLGARYLGFDNINAWDDLNRPATSYSAHTLKAQAGYGFSVLGFQSALSVGFAQNHIAEANYETLLASLGVRRPIGMGLSAGLSATNADIWSSSARDVNGENPFPPTALQAGLAYEKTLPAGLEAAIALDARTRNDEKMVWPVGAELTWHHLLTLRLGYPVQEPDAFLNGGIGISWSNFRFNYAYQGHAQLGGGHYGSLEIAY